MLFAGDTFEPLVCKLQWNHPSEHGKELNNADEIEEFESLNITKTIKNIVINNNYQGMMETAKKMKRK